MRIALDARTLYAAQRRGIGRATLRLYRELAAIRPQWRIDALHRREAGGVEPLDAELAAMPEGFWTPRPIEMPGDRFDAWTRYRLPLEAAWLDADALHCPANACPPRARTPTVVTLHDLIPLDTLGVGADAARRRFAGWVRAAEAAASAIVCVSEHTADALTRRCPTIDGRVRVCRHGVDPPAPVTDADRGRVASRYAVDRPYVLHFGASDPRKNTSRALEAWAKLPPGRRAAHRLIVVGLDDATRRRMSASLAAMGLGDGVRLHGFAEACDVTPLLAGARAMLFPTLNEGFGLPVLEAFAAGTPVITTRRASIPEVAGDAAVYVDPLEPLSIAAAIDALLSDRPERERRSAAGRARAESFTWRAAAETMAGVFESIVAARPNTRKAA